MHRYYNWQQCDKSKLWKPNQYVDEQSSRLKKFQWHLQLCKLSFIRSDIAKNVEILPISERGHNILGNIYSEGRKQMAE